MTNVGIALVHHNGFELIRMRGQLQCFRICEAVKTVERNSCTDGGGQGQRSGRNR